MSNELSITIDNVTNSLRGWARASGINRSTIDRRYRQGVRGKDLIKPVKKPLMPEIFGEKKTVEEWENDPRSNVCRAYIRQRWNDGVRGEALLRRKTPEERKKPIPKPKAKQVTKQVEVPKPAGVKKVRERFTKEQVIHMSRMAAIHRQPPMPDAATPCHLLKEYNHDRTNLC